MAVRAGRIALEAYADIMAGMKKPEARLQIRAEVDKIAKEGAEYGRSEAPRLQEPHYGFVRGHFAASIHAEETDDHDGLPSARIVSYSRVAHLLEFGTVNMPEHATFGKIAAHFGGSVDRVDTEGHVTEGRRII